MMRKIWQRRRSDRADSSLVTFVLVMPLFFSFIVTMIDTSIYFSNRATVQQVARDSARQVAIFGGAGDATTQTPLEAAYGTRGACAALADRGARATHKNEIECQLLKRYDEGSGLTNVTITRVSCGVVPAGTTTATTALSTGQTSTIGQATRCDVDWTYNGVPGSTMNFVKSSDGKPPFNLNKTRVSSQSEVNMTGIASVRR